MKVLTDNGNGQYGSKTITVSDVGAASYTTGSWTPTLLGSTTVGTPTYAFQTGYYEKFGNLVVARMQVGITAKGGMVGNIAIGGLPFTTANTALTSGGGDLGIITGFSLPSGYVPGCIYIPINQNIILLLSTSNVGFGNFTDSYITDSFLIKTIFQYFTV